MWSLLLVIQRMPIETLISDMTLATMFPEPRLLSFSRFVDNFRRTIHLWSAKVHSMGFATTLMELVCSPSVREHLVQGSIENKACDVISNSSWYGVR